MQNSDAIVIMGSNFAECHPVGFRWAMKARERGCRLIHVDPRFTRTSAMCDLHVPIRSGTDIAFLGGLVNYIIANERWFKDYVLHYTNAATIVSETFQDTEELDGLFSGFDPAERHYDNKLWAYDGTLPGQPAQAKHAGQAIAKEGQPGVDFRRHPPHGDPTLQHPRCVFQIMKRHYARYTPEMVSRICGCSEAHFLEVARTLCDNSGRERTSAFAYDWGTAAAIRDRHGAAVSGGVVVGAMSGPGRAPGADRPSVVRNRARTRSFAPLRMTAWVLLALLGCSPEAQRVRDGGPGADPGNKILVAHDGPDPQAADTTLWPGRAAAPVDLLEKGVIPPPTYPPGQR